MNKNKQTSKQIRKIKQKRRKFKKNQENNSDITFYEAFEFEISSKP